MKMQKKLFLAVFLGSFALMGSGQNLVRNGSFTEADANNKPATWFGKADPANSVDNSTVPEDGKNAYKVGSSTMLNQHITVKPATTYKLTYFLKTDKLEGRSAASVQLMWLDSQYNNLFKEYTDPTTGKISKIWDMNTQNTVAKNDWKSFEMTVKSPANAANCTLRFGLVFESVGTFWISGISMTEVAETL